MKTFTIFVLIGSITAALMCTGMIIQRMGYDKGAHDAFLTSKCIYHASTQQEIDACVRHHMSQG